MWPRLNQSFGTLAQTGFNGHKFPICIGETGSFYDFSLKVCLLWQTSISLLQITQLHRCWSCWMAGPVQNCHPHARALQ